MARYPHAEKRMRTTVLTFASSPYSLLAADEYLACNATGGAITINLPALATVLPGMMFSFTKTDTSVNAVTLDASGIETINGQLTFVVYGQYDSVTLISTPTGWLIVNFTPGTLLVPNDTVEFLILDRAAGFANLANVAAAEADATARAAAFSLVGYGRFVITIDVTTAGAPTTLYIAARISGKSAPAIATVADWSYEAADNIDRATGISSSQPYQVNIPANGVRRFTRSFRNWGSWGSALIWVDGAGCQGQVYAQRFTS